MTDHPLRTLACRVVGLADATHDTRIVSLEAVDGTRFDFAAGQYAVVSFSGLPGRDYSMANRPGATPIEFHIRRMAGAGFKAYLAGPPAMVDATVEALAAHGLPRADIHADPFVTDAEKRARQRARDAS